MTNPQSIRADLGLSREKLAQESGVELAAIYLLERMGTAGPVDDAKIIDTLNRYQLRSLPRCGPDCVPIREDEDQNQMRSPQVRQRHQEAEAMLLIFEGIRRLREGHLRRSRP